MKNLQILIISCILLWSNSLSALSNTQEQALILPDVIIKSNYQEVLEIPVIKHEFRMLPARYARETYLPSLPLHKIRLPFGFPQNVELSDLAKSRSLENYLAVTGAETKFGYAVVLFANSEYSRSKEIFQELVPIRDEVSEISRLYLSWILIIEKEEEQINKLLQPLESSKSDFIQQELAYLKAYVAFQKGKYKQSLSFIEELKNRFGTRLLNYRHKYLQATAHAYLKEWQKAELLIDDLIKVVWSPWYRDVLYLSIQLNYQKRNYSLCLDSLEKWIRLGKGTIKDIEVKKLLSWLLYLNGNYEKSRQSLNSWYANDFEIRQERNYLEMLLSLKTGDWKNAQLLYLNIQPTSDWKQYAVLNLIRLYRNKGQLAWLDQKMIPKTFQHPDMGVYVFHQLGMIYFEEGSLKKSEKSLLNALKYKPEDGESQRIQANLALISLYNTDFESAEKQFKELLKTESIGEISRYHYAFTLYQLKKWKELNQAFSIDQIKEVKNQRHKDELSVVKSVALALSGDKKGYWSFLRPEFKRNREFMKVGFQLSFYQNHFDRIIQFEQEAVKNPDSAFIWLVKALLAKGEYKKALVLVNTKVAKDESLEMLSLKIDVWKANGMYKAIIQEMDRLIAKTENRDKLVNYYIILGDSLYNEKKFAPSKNALYKALLLSGNENQKQMIQYNLFITNRQLNNHSTFTREGQLLLKKEIPNTMRLNITEALANHYIQKRNYIDAEKVLRGYLRKTNHEQARISLKLTGVLSVQNKNEDCLNNARAVMKGETIFQKRDRILSGGECALKVSEHDWIVEVVPAEVKQDESYRKNELFVLLASAYFQSKRFNESNKSWNQINLKELNESKRLAVRVQHAKTLSELDRKKESMKVLGSVDDYLNTPWYQAALNLKVSLQKGDASYQTTIRDLYRLYYLPEKTDSEKAIYLLQIAGLYKTAGEADKAETILNRINPDHIKSQKAWLKRYQLMKKNGGIKK